MRLQGRHNEGRMEYQFSVEGPIPAAAAGRPRVAPHIKLYSDIRWNYDRHRIERPVIHTGSENDFYKREWFSLETGECTYWKEGKLSDPDMHGKSARRGKKP
jgi:hypothetical protein